jgi:hypothetical protein
VALVRGLGGGMREREIHGLGLRRHRVFDSLCAAELLVSAVGVNLRMGVWEWIFMVEGLGVKRFTIDAWEN